MGLHHKSDLCIPASNIYNSLQNISIPDQLRRETNTSSYRFITRFFYQEPLAVTVNTDFEALKSKLALIVDYIKSDKVFQPSDYFENQELLKDLKRAYDGVNKHLNQTMLRLLQHPTQGVSQAFLDFQMVLSQTHLFIIQFDEYNHFIKDNLDQIESLNNIKEHQRFLQTMPAHFETLRKAHAEVFKGKENTGNYSRSLGIITLCESAIKHIESLSKSAGKKYSTRTQIEEKGIESILWHPENHKTSAAIEKAIRDLVIQYVTLFYLSLANQKVLGFFESHPDRDSVCFEKASKIISKWAIENKLLDRQDALDAIENKTSLTVVAEENNWSELKQCLSKHPGTTYDDIIKIDEFVKHLDHFIEKQFETLSKDDSEKPNNEVLDILMKEIEDDYDLKPLLKDFALKRCIEICMLDEEKQQNTRSFS